MFRKDSGFYSRVDDAIKGNWFMLLFWYVVVNSVSYFMSYSSDILVFKNYFGGINIIDIKDFFFTEFSFDSVSFSIGLITSILGLMLNMEILSFVRTKKFDIKNFGKYLINYPVQIIGVSLILYVVQSLVSYIPIVGFFIDYFIYFAFSYASYLVLVEKEKNPIKVLINSWNHTNGVKGELLSKYIHYFKNGLIGMVVKYTGLIIATLSVSNKLIYMAAVILAMLGFVVSIIYKFKNSPYYYLACAMYFKEHMEYKGIRL